MTQWTVEELQRTEWFEPLVRQVQREIDRLAVTETDRRPALEREYQDVQGKIRGWAESLGKTDLNPGVRSIIESDVASALQQRAELERRLDERDAMCEQTRSIIDPKAIVDRLNHLPEVLAANDPTRTNLELSLHIDAIRCSKDGQVVVRTCKLGALAGAIEMLADPNPTMPPAVPADDSVFKATPRRRSRRRVPNRDENGADLRAIAFTASDVNRFAGLGPEWFWEDKFEIPEPTYWAKAHAAAVAARRDEGLTQEQLATQFGVTLPTIRKALRIAAQMDPARQQLPRKLPRRRWAPDHFREVLEKKLEGISVKQLCNHFGKSEPIIREALRLSEQGSEPTQSESIEDGLPESSSGQNPE